MMNSESVEFIESLKEWKKAYRWILQGNVGYMGAAYQILAWWNSLMTNPNCSPKKGKLPYKSESLCIYYKPVGYSE